MLTIWLFHQKNNFFFFLYFKTDNSFFIYIIFHNIINAAWVSCLPKIWKDPTDSELVFPYLKRKSCIQGLQCGEKQTKNKDMDNIKTKTDILKLCLNIVLFYNLLLNYVLACVCVCVCVFTCVTHLTALQLHMWVDQKFRDVSDVKESRRNFHTSQNRWQDLTANPQRHASVSPQTLLTFLLQDKCRISSRIWNVSYTNTPSVALFLLPFFKLTEINTDVSLNTSSRHKHRHTLSHTHTHTKGAGANNRSSLELWPLNNKNNKGKNMTEEINTDEDQQRSQMEFHT